MDYRPQPIDTSSIELSSGLRDLTERLSENIHELWATERIAQGWTFGPLRNDSEKRHPCLVPYDQLPESEKRFDRITATGTVKTILSLGYKIIPPQES